MPLRSALLRLSCRLWDRRYLKVVVIVTVIFIARFNTELYRLNSPSWQEVPRSILIYNIQFSQTGKYVKYTSDLEFWLPFCMASLNKLRGQVQYLSTGLFRGKKYFYYCFFVILMIDSTKFSPRFFLCPLRCHDSTTRLENIAVTALAQNANSIWIMEIAVNRKFH